MKTISLAGRSPLRWWVPLLVVALAALLLSACVKGPAGPAGPQGLAGSAGAAAPRELLAEAELKDANGKAVGVASFAPQGQGVVVRVVVSDLPVGTHGLHIHAAGKCEAPGFTTAGGHLNPQGAKHGLLSPLGAHAGDMPNLVVAQNGTGSLDVVSFRVSLAAGAPNSLLQEAGTALVLHAGPDDETTDPTGNSGARIACGVITRK